MPNWTLTELVDDARRRVQRLDPGRAREAARNGAVIVDIRSDRARTAGVVPGSIHIPRTVLEWRLAPGSDWRNEHVSPDDRVLLLCDHGCSSLLAAATLAELGVDVADVLGGFEAWRDAGLPLVPAAPVAGDQLPGMGRPEATHG
jgi:rhodanese-related sulfurtransferase